jgi:hypothetical protein
LERGTSTEAAEPAARVYVKSTTGQQGDNTEKREKKKRETLAAETKDEKKIYIEVAETKTKSYTNVAERQKRSLYTEEAGEVREIYIEPTKTQQRGACFKKKVRQERRTYAGAVRRQST